MHKSGIRYALFTQIASKYTNVLLQLILTAILARLITPEDFGILAIIFVFTTFFTLLSDMGLGPAVVQFRDLQKNDFDALFFFSFILGIGLTGIFCIASIPISIIYADNRLIQLCCISSIAIFFNSLNMVPNGIMLRNREFKSIGFRLVIATLISGSISIVAACLGLGIYALIINSVLSPLVVLIWNLLSTRLTLLNIHFMKPLKMIFSYSIYQAGFGLVNYFSRNLDNMLIGGQMGMSTLGYYDKAYKLTTYPLNYLSGIIGSVLQPFLSEFQDNPIILAEKWNLIVRPLSIVATFVASFMICCSQEVVFFFYGDQWIESAVLLQILGFSLFFQILNNPTGAVLQSSGHTDYLFRNSLITTSITIVLLFVGLAFGDIKYIAAGISVAYCLHTIPIVYYLVHKTFGASVVEYIKEFIYDIIILLLSCSVCLFLSSLVNFDYCLSLIMKLLVLVIMLSASYSAIGRLSSLAKLFNR